MGRSLVDEAHARLAHAVEDLHVREGRDELADRVVEREVPLFIEHHHGDAGYRLGHRVQAEDGVLVHGNTPLSRSCTP